MHRLSSDAYQTLIQGATPLEVDSHGPKVFLLQDHSFLKLFRRKRLLSSEAIYSYAMRFSDNARALTYLGIPAPEIIGVYRIEAPQRTAVHYRGLPGITLRRAMTEADPLVRSRLAERFGVLLATLHERGIYFRSLHLGNVILMPDDRLGLIDFADMTLHKRALSSAKRARNLKHMQRYEVDKSWLFGEHNGEVKRGYESVNGSKIDWSIS
jgi:tRNA A-37 threonylcarbamoyl transferase component Bud32